MKIKVEVHVLYYYEHWLLPYIIRHYRTYASKLVIHNAGQPLKLRPAKGVVIMPWDCHEVSNTRYMELCNSCWKGTNADFVIVVDADEFIWFPEGAAKTLAAYMAKGAAVIKTHGFEMFSGHLPTGPGQIYDEIKFGAPDDKWYAKPCLFSPKLVRDSALGIGQHEADPVLHDGRKLRVGHDWPFATPPAYLLHYHQIGPAEAIAARYEGNIERMCAENREKGWGNLKKGMVHVREKRDYIFPLLDQVVP